MSILRAGRACGKEGLAWDSWGRLEDVWSVVNHSMFLSRVRAFFYS